MYLLSLGVKGLPPPCFVSGSPEGRQYVQGSALWDNSEFHWGEFIFWSQSWMGVRSVQFCSRGCKRYVDVKIIIIIILLLLSFFGGE